jgi:hypothetical protein
MSIFWDAWSRVFDGTWREGEKESDRVEIRKLRAMDIDIGMVV